MDTIPTIPTNNPSLPWEIKDLTTTQVGGGGGIFGVEFSGEFD